METENTNTNEGSNVVTENAPDMNEFEQVQSVEEVIEETSEEKTTNEIINEKSKELQEVQNLPDDSNIQEPALETVNIEIQGANVSDVNEETKEEVINTNTETPTESIPEPNETIIESEIVVPSTEKNDETNKIENSTIDNQNKESLIVEEVVMTPPINNDELSKIDNVIMDQNVTEESPITEITNMPEEESQNTEMFEEQVNNIQNNYYSAVNNKNQNAKTSIMKPVGVENYKFSSEPRAIPAPSQRRKYRDPYELEKMLSIQKNEFNQEKQRIACNIMYDPRVVRGNTYAAKILPLQSEPDPLELHKQEEMKRRAKARKRAAEKRRIKTPEPVEGRHHVEIQTDLYLEELYDKVPEAIAATQTDLFLDRAPSPLYIPQKSGIDAATQIYDGELFDFNFEVEPILEVLVGKTLEQALIEVMEEEELEMLRKHQIDFEEKRNAELAEVQRLEDAERRRTEEKNRRITEKLKLMEEKKEVVEKIAARSFTNSYLSNLIPSVFETLNDNGFFYDPRETEIENYFLPWLTHKSNNYVDKIRTSRLLLDHIILSSIEQLNDMGRPILKGLKGRKIKKSKVNIPLEDWLNPDNTYKCTECKEPKY